MGNGPWKFGQFKGVVMSKIGVASDSTCDLSKELLDRYGITILPLHVILDDKEFRDGVDIHPKDISSMKIEVPDYDEQFKIATYLSTMDKEIAALEAERDKYKNIKQGMMQKLLTGQIRLPV